MSVDIRRSRSLKDHDFRSSSRLSDVRGNKSSTGTSDSRNNSDQESRGSVRSDRRPNRSVSFNRDVHVKRYAHKLDRQLSRIDESPVETSDEMKETTRTRGRADGNEEIKYNRENDLSTTITNTPTSKNYKSSAHKEGLTQRIKAFFTGKTSKSKKNVVNSGVNTSTTDEESDPLYQYKQYKNSSKDTIDSRNWRRGSSSTNKSDWFRSLERNKSGGSKGNVNESGHLSRSARNLRYFGESDSNLGYGSLARSRKGSRYLDDTSQDETTDMEAPPNKYGSLVYLHAAAVRDIPPRSSGSRLSVNRDDVSDNNSTMKRKTKKSLTRSFSLSGPWTPTHKPKNLPTIQTTSKGVKESSGTIINHRLHNRDTRGRSSTNLRDSTDSTSRQIYIRSETPIVGPNRNNKLPTLVFTGPSIEHTLRREWRGRV